MRTTVFLLFLLGLAPGASAAVNAADFPAGTVWYLHADLERMRATESGSGMYNWLNGEIFVEINDEVGIDLNREVERLTAYSHDQFGTVIVVDGPVTRETRDKLLAIVALQAKYDVHEFSGKTYYFASDGPGIAHDNGPLRDLDGSAYFSFDVPGKMIVASQEGQMHELLANNGRIAGGGSHNGALFVLSADREFVKAGLRTEHFAGSEDSWDSNILRNTEQAAFMLSDRGGMLAFDLQLKSKDPRMAESIGSIVNGLVSLQMFNADLDPDVRALIENTRIKVEDAMLNLSAVIDPKLLMRIIDD